MRARTTRPHFMDSVEGHRLEEGSGESGTAD